jgi:hypothetical protein
MSSKSKFGKPRRGGLVAPAARNALANNIFLIFNNREQFHGPALIKLLMTLNGIPGADVAALSDARIAQLWELVFAVIDENRDAYARLTPPGSHDDCALDLQNGFNAVGLPDSMAWQAPILARGGSIILSCPACTADGIPHTLELQQVDGQFLAFAKD